MCVRLKKEKKKEDGQNATAAWVQDTWEGRYGQSAAGMVCVWGGGRGGGVDKLRTYRKKKSVHSQHLTDLRAAPCGRNLIMAPQQLTWTRRL